MSFLFLWIALTLASRVAPACPAPAADTARLRRHLLALTTTPEPRNYLHLATDTAFYRNKHCHEPTDTLDRLDMRRLGLAVDAVLAVVLRL